MTGVLLLLGHPKVANRDCQHCLEYMYDEDTGLPTKGRDKKFELRLVQLGDEFKAPCRNETGCPKGTPENPLTLWPENQLCYQHYLECKAVGQFPDDATCRRNAAIIQNAERLIAEKRNREQQNNLAETILAAMVTA